MATTYTQAECVELFINAVAAVVTENANAPGLTTLERCQQTAQGILAIIDGETPDVPLMILAPHPDPEAVAFHLAVPENWWPEGELEFGEDISGSLVDAWTETL